MSEFILEKILNFAKGLRISEPLSVLILVLTAPLSGILAFHLRIFLKEFLIDLSPIEIPFLGYILGREYDLVPALTEGTVGLIIWFLLFLGVRRGLDSLIDRYLIWLSLRQKKLTIDFRKLSHEGFKNDWIIQGSPILRNDGLAFTNSNSGCLIKRGSYWIFSDNLRKWKNFKAQITIDFVQESHIVNDQILKIETESERIVGWKQKSEEFRQVLGIVFGAQNLEDYFMLELWRVGNTLSVRPHIRMSGNWDAPIYNAPKKINLSKKLAEVTLKVKDNIAFLSIENKKVLELVLPEEFEANLIQHPQPSPNLESGVVINIPFNEKVGMFGFRNYGNELAVVKKLVIESLK